MKTGTSLERHIGIDSGGPIRAAGRGFATVMVESLGRCAKENRGEEVWLRGAAGVADAKYVCLKNASDAYAWVGTTPFAAVLTGSTTWDPGNISGGVRTSTAVTVTGAAVGDPAVCGFTPNVSDVLVCVATVTAANTCTAVLHNVTNTLASDLGSGTVRCTVFKSA